MLHDYPPQFAGHVIAFKGGKTPKPPAPTPPPIPEELLREEIEERLLGFRSRARGFASTVIASKLKPEPAAKPAYSGALRSGATTMGGGTVQSRSSLLSSYFASGGSEPGPARAKPKPATRTSGPRRGILVRGLSVYTSGRR